MKEDFSLDEIITNLQKGRETGSRFNREEAARPEEPLDDETLKMLLVLCQSKAEEFAAMGYEAIKAEEIWRYVKSQYQNGYPSLHRMVNDILGLKTTKFMNWITINAYKGM